MKFTYPLAVIALVSAMGVAADLTVTEPRTDHWWVAQSLNTLAWEGSDPAQFSVFLSNPDQNVLTSILALTSVTYAYDKSKSINPGGITLADGYTILLTDPINSTHVYAQSETFEIKPVGSTYPPQNTAPTGSAASSGSGAASGCQSASASASASGAQTSQSGSGSSSASRTVVGAGAGAAIVGAALAVVGAMTL